MCATWGTCPYHGKYRAVEWHDWNCPKCGKELQDFAAFRSGRSASLGTSAKLIKRMTTISKKGIVGQTARRF